MNVYFHELKVNFKFTAIWLIIMIFIGLLMTSFYPSIAKDLDAFVNIIANYPESIRNTFGINLNTMNTIVGYYSSFPLTFLLICSTIEAMIMGVAILSKEVREKTADFLFTKPIRKFKIMFSKLKAVVTLLLFSNIILTIIMANIIFIFNNGSFAFYTFLLLNGSLFIMQLFFLTLGMLVSVIIKKVKSPISIALPVVLGLYMINVFTDDKVRLLIPFKYFNINYILNNVSYEISYLVFIFSMILILTIATYLIYSKKDIEAV